MGSWFAAPDSSVTTDVSTGIGVGQRTNDYDDNGNWTNMYPYPLSTYYFQNAGVIDLAQVWSTHSRTYYAGNEGRRMAYNKSLWGSTSPVANNVPTFALGDDAYACLFVRSADMAQKVAASAAVANKATRTVGAYNYGKDYAINIVPEGPAGSWVDGTFESFLMAPWAYASYRNALGDASQFGACTDYVRDFYDYFYRCSYQGACQSFGLDNVVVAHANQG